MSLESVLYDIQKTKDLQEKLKKEGKNFKAISESAFETVRPNAYVDETIKRRQRQTEIAVLNKSNKRRKP